MKNQPSDRAIAGALGPHARESSGTCPDDNILAAYLEFRLGLAERQRFEAHAAACKGCQEILGLAMRLQPSEAPGTAREAIRPGRKVLFRFTVPVSAIALILAGVSLAVFVPRMFRQADAPQGAVQVAENRPAPSLREKSLPRKPETSGRPAQELPAPASRQSIAASPAPVPASGAGASPPAARPPAARDSAAATGLPAPAGPPPTVVSAEPTPEPLRADEAPARTGEQPTPAPPFQAGQAAISQASVTMKMEVASSEKPKDTVRDSAPAGAATASAVTDRKALRAANVAAVAAAPELDTGPPLRAGSKTFRQAGNLIVDLEALAHPDAPRVELGADSREFAAIVAGVQGLDRLLQPGRTLTIYWQGKNCVVRR